MTTNDYPGLTIVARQAFDRAKGSLPPDVGIAILFAFHYGDGGGFAWVAGADRDESIAFVVEWLAHQVKHEGKGDIVKAAFERWFAPLG